MVKRSGAIDNLRGICILMVLYVHSLAHFTPEDSLMFGPISFGTAINNFGFSVTIFFVLSGYVLMLPYIHGREFAAYHFYKRRALRLLPLLWIVTIISLVMYPLPPYALELLPHIPLSTYTLLLATNDQNGTSIPGNPALWTMSVEIFGALLFPLFFYYVNRIRFIMLAMFLAALLIVWLQSHHGPQVIAPFRAGNIIALLTGLVAFLLGIQLARRPISGKWILYLGFALTFAALELPINYVPSLIDSPHVNYTLFQAGAMMIRLVAAFCLVAGIIQTEFSWQPLRYLGIICYSLYLWHMPLMGYLGNNTHAEGFAEQSHLVLVSTLKTIAFATFTFFAIEKLDYILPRLWRWYWFKPQKQVVARG